MPLKVIAVHKRSLAARAKIAAGDTILSINAMPVNDFFDLEYYSNDYQLDLELRDHTGEGRSVTILRQNSLPLGIEPEPYQHLRCHNHCVFCFIDQLPPGLRATLYQKDDDFLYSYVFGNYITLSNLREADWQRIITQHITPLYISVHSTDPALRRQMMHYQRELDVLKCLRKLARNGISYHLQIVCVPGWNTGQELRRTLSDLLDTTLSTLSIGVVPVGLTGHRQGLEPLQPVDKNMAREILSLCAEARSHKQIVYAADELFVTAGEPIPGVEYYADFPQLENGIGMLRLTLLNFRKKKPRLLKELDKPGAQYLILTSRLALLTLQEIADSLNERFIQARIRVQAINNDFLGGFISVSGLLAAWDILQQHAALPGEAILIPSNLFNHDGVSLDGVSALELKMNLRRPLLLVDQFFEDWDWI